MKYIAALTIGSLVGFSIMIGRDLSDLTARVSDLENCECRPATLTQEANRSRIDHPYPLVDERLREYSSAIHPCCAINKQ